jgi:non-homologous end joining protein Ku
VRASGEIGEEIEGAAVPTPEQVENAVAIIEELEVPFDPTGYRDEHRAHLERVIKRKQKGRKISVPAPSAEPAKPIPTAPDLMGALEQSLARIRGETTAGGKKKKVKKKAKTPASPHEESPREARPSGSSTPRA